MSQTPLAQMKGISKAFSGNRVLENVEFEIMPGEVHALMGENGAGKSTLMKILTGIYERDSGSVYIKGEEVHFKNAKEAENAGIAVIHQELNIIPYLSVTDNMFLGKELTYGKLGIVKHKEMQQKTKKYLNRLGVDIDPDIEAGELSVGQQQMIEIARAIAANAEILIMDEPTAALTDREIEALFVVINSLRKKGVGIVYISHRMEEIFQICDRISVLRDGQFIGTKDIPTTNFDEIVKMMVGRQLGDRFPERNTTLGPERLKIENFSCKGKFENISFSVKQGEILGVAGLMGAGRTEIMEAIFGHRHKQNGTMMIDGQVVSIKSPFDAIKKGIGFVTEDRKSEGLVLDLSVRENFSLTNLTKISTNSLISTKQEESFVDDLIQKLHVKTASRDLAVKSLSGGNQQKIVIGKWLGIEPKILILDEPTRGVDVGAKKEIYQIMNQLTEQGVAIIMVSSELPEILGMSDRILVIHEGKVSAILSRAEANQEKIMQAATGGNE
ncbi:sugar ABC transporter ATP-binding protein [Metabacillus sediminilitoris]|uniref:Sugar ABC transporter ATP-binding protein n=1 Tax=Metabacillus sediminilitoris TaxID=2567941 RepID=A0A4S4C1I3_9BACI|nr:sugar ABC transporter ATP-binding protein [Metabacillus sediminilitoris]QGQ48124.1 ATP-binding cassette domain-containing protein [Metabacillus sediminilitoris]THF81513.1 sugar ABC transporter ATP-binding protein [Metabacillus sediminilitoris]